MKKFYLILMAVTALSLVTLSCTKELADPSQQEQIQKEEDPAKDAGEEQTIPEGMISLTFGVSQEGDAAASDEDTKTSWNGTTHAWSEGDKIRIFWGTGSKEYVDAEVKNDKVTALVGDAAYYYAVYPASDADSDFVLNDDGKIDVSIPKEQNGTFASANKMVARTAKAEASFAFKNVTYIFKFSLTSACAYDNFVFTSNENAKLIVDAIGVTFNDSNEISLGASTTSYSTFGNTHSKYVYLNNLTAGSDYYFAVVPGAVFTTGFGVKAHINGSTSEDDYDLGALSKANITTTRSHIVDLGNLDEMIHADWFFAPDGTGKGTSWEDAGGLNLFLSLLTSKTNDNGVNSTWRLKNAKLHFKEGTYNIEEANGGTLTFQSGAWDQAAEDKYKVKNVTVIDGGYPSSNTGTSLAGQDVKNCPTKFICNQSANNDRIFYFNGCVINDLQFKGITFTANPSASNNNSRGVAFFFNSTTSGKVTFDNCYFTELVSASTNGGGAIDFNSTGELSVSFSNCTFTSNAATSTKDNYGGGAIVIEQGESTVISFDKCVADGNTSSSANGHGGFIYQKGGTINITDCEIKNSSAAKRGGAICTNAVLNVDNTTFASNSASNGGAIHTEAGTVNISGNTTFSKNSATNGGAIRSSGPVVLNIDNATFTENTATNGGGIAFEYDAGASVNVTNSIFRANSNSAILNKGAMKVVGCVFESNSTEDKGSAIYTVGANGKTAIAKIFNSQFEGNESTPTDGSGSNMKGCTVITGSYAYALVANSTFSGNIEHSKSHGVISPGTSTSTKVYVVSSTLSENLFSDGSSTSAGPDFARTTSYLLVYNTISTNTAESIANVVVQNSIFKLRCFKDNRNTFEDLAAFGLGTYSNGVYPLDATYSDAYNKGMEVADIQALTYDGNITLTEEEKALLAKDQKGNDRGTIMGAYVKTTAPTTE